MELGLLTKAQLRGPAFRRLHPDVYIGAEAEIDVETRVQALSVWSHDRGIIAGPLAALAYGADCQWEDPEIVLDQHCRRSPAGVLTRVDRLPEDEVDSRFGALLTSPARTAFDLARRSPLVEAVAAVDALAFREKFGADALRRVADRHPGARGLVQVRQVIDLMEPLAESLPETRLRLGLLERGVPPATAQLKVRLRTGKGTRLDLAWPEHMVALEYDGPEHRSISGQNRDAFDRARLGDLGWDIGVVTSAMVMDPRAFDELAARVLRKVT
ncbi:hypothetical protein [Actinomycetospora termitidis]|uniref:DUF559 domain-containing protein n=1 Tax=Actinomycetospora termitidis TaxID=3053470 RepID=A0ABT7MGT1_9PSEU|nr:hypothetical protein [Actinomycetospora sp. Odt1-22]MDL5159860.1 hypothetical protein [Actinomycetospora sp. Odt1-22]